MVESLNREVEYAIKVNSMLNPNDPKPGVMALGDAGIEYRANNGVGFIQIPWENIKLVRAQVMWKNHIRGFYIDLDDSRTINFVASDAIPALKVMREHLGSAKLVRTKTIVGSVSKWWRKRHPKKA
ncbi:DUF956 family protein [Lacticaseibacillus saniviri]|uniref:Uncharacterized protein n=1 Tax=Lacticaseibacillus saniviri JCM 17471 = DSM 24301 TaxID=1293598 RepID=A0A0R2MRQ9_9LACO|nr:DUF956 family protein [Lacticaseibacillus saniviri]KRO16279.1 hypothetical protein IV56_GL001640 [Lacticaseibacillus saniviri JCM 17471 = DSM 24301]MCG4281845.1 DUF956 family protein [Lacticaseibacillus saniviri]